MLIQPPPEGASGPAAGPERTLIVEDDYTSRTVLARLLRAHGRETYSASTVADAFSQLDELFDGEGNRPTYLILDLMLPDGLGTAVLRRIRDDRPGAAVRRLRAATGGGVSEAAGPAEAHAVAARVATQSRNSARRTRRK